MGSAGGSSSSPLLTGILLHHTGYVKDQTSQAVYVLTSLAAHFLDTHDLRVPFLGMVWEPVHLLYVGPTLLHLSTLSTRLYLVQVTTYYDHGGVGGTGLRGRGQ